MTRWDCDVKLWRDVPCSFPAFHGWPLSSLDIVQSSTASVRYICCGACYEWVPECSRYHNCLSKPAPRTKPSHAHLISDTDVIAATAAASATLTTDSTANDTTIDYDNTPFSEDLGLEENTKQSVYVVVTDDNEDAHICGICSQRMRLEFVQDIEEWVFMDCVEHDRVPVHELCRDCVYG